MKHRYIKRIILCTVVLFSLSFNKALSQTPQVIWSKTFGGSNKDYGNCIRQTFDSGFIAIGRTYSSDGQVTGYHGVEDIWVIRLSKDGTLLWQKCLGSSGIDQGLNIIQTADSGFAFTGYVWGSDGDVTNYFGGQDVWVGKLDKNGTLTWAKSYGGSHFDAGYAIQQTSDGGYIVACATASNDNEVTGNHGGTTDGWILKINDTGAVGWSKCYGGSNEDIINSIYQTADGGYIASGYTRSSDGDVAVNRGDYDYWVFKINDTGSIVWEQTYGGSNSDMATMMSPVNNAYVVTGESNSIDGDITNHFGGNDMWNIKIDSAGNKIWSKCYGGADEDAGSSVMPTNDGGVITCGTTTSLDGDVTNNYGNGDMWLIKTDAAGNLQWQKNLGGDSIDAGAFAIPTFDNAIVAFGWTRSVDHDLSSSHGSADMWAIKLAVPEVVTTPIKQPISVYPIPANYILNFQLPDDINYSAYSVFDVLGKSVISSSCKEGNNSIYVSNLPSGLYFLQIAGYPTPVKFIVLH
jgi:hypothetical protein